MSTSCQAGKLKYQYYMFMPERLSDSFLSDCFIPEPDADNVGSRRSQRLEDLLIADQSEIPDEHATFNGERLRIGIQTVNPYPMRVEAVTLPSSEPGAK